MKKFIYLLTLVMVSTSLFAQQKDSRNWQHLDVAQDSMYGVSSEKAHKELLKGKKGQTVIVAVLDSGVDFDHEDLKDVMWVNPGEIAGNGIDDDGNGYIDDIHGWNFLGGKDGQNVGTDTYEVTRLYSSLKYKFDNVDSTKLNKKQMKEFRLYQKVKNEVESKVEKAKANYDRIKTQKGNMLAAIDKFGEMFGDKEISMENIEAFEVGEDEDAVLGKQIIKGFMQNGDKVNSFDEIKNAITSSFDRGLKHYENQYKYAYNTEFNPRTIVGDDYSNSYEKGYGNNVYDGPDAFHGTHVAGIIAATRNNNIGMDGIANNVKIMTVRVVPDGDERDKDVANGIIYAADNGASIINMSFGKAYSWDKTAVDKAVKYAQKKGVLIVSAAGNNSENNDEIAHYPIEQFAKKKLCGKKSANNWVIVGALNFMQDKNFPARFTNFGKEDVDLFAPGVQIYSTIPDNGYGDASGTSMASPVVAGVAAVVRSYYPKLSPKKVKKVLMESVTPINNKVVLPGTKDQMVNFSDLSVSGGVVNLYNALKKAEEMSK